MADVIELNRQKENHPTRGDGTAACGDTAAQKPAGVPNRRTVAPHAMNNHRQTQPTAAGEVARRIPRVTCE